jgi:hypothetical protein
MSSSHPLFERIDADRFRIIGSLGSRPFRRTLQTVVA